MSHPEHGPLTEEDVNLVSKLESDSLAANPGRWPTNIESQLLDMVHRLVPELASLRAVVEAGRKDIHSYDLLLKAAGMESAEAFATSFDRTRMALAALERKP